jgi:glycerate kinase
MKIVIVPDSFKGSASSQEVAQWIENGILNLIPDCETVKIAIGDGGEGTLDAVISAGFNPIEVSVTGPTNKTVQSKFGIRDSTALVELAQASGLSQLPQQKLEPLIATSYGTGELIKAALDHGAKKIILAVGGSACTDAGAGALQALGAKLRDGQGREIAQGGAALQECQEIDLSLLDPRIAGVEFILASDVTNPLLGIHGAAHVYSPQKGASAAELLEQALTHFSEIAGSVHINTPGAGAAGGFGYMALTFLNAQARSGIEMVLDLVNFEKHLLGADLVITGEGKFDSQSLSGKAPIGILEIASKRSVPVALICGQATLNSSDEIVARFQSITALHSLELDIDKCITQPGPIIEKIATSIAKAVTS